MGSVKIIRVTKNEISKSVGVQFKVIKEAKWFFCFRL